MRPELAWGLDVGVERYPGAAGFLGANLYARRIDNLFQQRVFNDNGTWISTTINNGSARIYGVELDAKFKLRDALVQAPNIDVRTGLTRNWSSADRIPGPDNRIALQAPLTLGIGADYKPELVSLTLGGNLNIERAGFARLSLENSARSQTRRKLDAYVVRPLAKGLLLRVTLTNIVRPKEITETTYDDGDLRQDQILHQPSYRSISAQLEFKP